MDTGTARPLALLLIEPATGLAARLHDQLLDLFPASLDIGVARSLREAMHHLSTRHVDVVLMDLMLPDYKGVDAVRAVRLTAPACALIALDAAGDERLLLTALRAGAHEALSAQGLTPRELRWAIERAVIRAQSQPGRSTPAPPQDSPAVPTRLIHDLNNALTSINGFAEVLLTRMPADDPARGPVEHIRKAGHRAAGLLQRLPIGSERTPAQPPSMPDVRLDALN
ncbi:response regulator [Nitrospira moscoviensis]|nr:response regulator [Nitrospira moscoviensis]